MNLLSADKVSRTLPLSFNMGLIPLRCNLAFFTSSDPEILKYEIKQQLKEITVSNYLLLILLFFMTF